MKRHLLITLLLMIPLLCSAQIFQFTFTGAAVCPTPGNTPTTQSPNTVVSPLNRVGTNCTSASAAFNSNNWSTNPAIDQNTYVEVTVFAMGGHQLNLSSFSFDTERSSTGPVAARIAMDPGTGSFSQSYDFVPTTSPKNILWDFPDVSVSAGYTVRFRIYGWSAGSTGGTMRLNNVQLQGTVTDQSMWNVTGNSGTNSSINFLGTTDNQDLVVKTNNTERLRINAAGRTAIGGPTHPDIAFKVYGRTQFITDTTSDGVDIINNEHNIADGSDLMWIKSQYAQSNNVGLLTISSANWQYPVFSARENGKVFMGVNGYNYLLPSCSDCNNYRLFVKDGIRTERIKIDVASANGWADYVFKKDYKLPTLEDVEKHISEKGHLPNVPSADEVVKNGINVGEMNAKLLEKIEELTLYSIELNKKNKGLHTKVQKQEQLIKQLQNRMNKLEKNSK